MAYTSYTARLNVLFVSEQSSDLDDMSKKSSASHLKPLQQRKQRRPMSAKVLLQDAKEHEEIMASNQWMHGDYWHREDSKAEGEIERTV